MQTVRATPGTEERVDNRRKVCHVHDTQSRSVAREARLRELVRACVGQNLDQARGVHGLVSDREGADELQAEESRMVIFDTIARGRCGTTCSGVPCADAAGSGELLEAQAGSWRHGHGVQGLAA